MVMTRGLKRKAKDKESAINRGHQTLRIIFPGFSSNLPHQGADARTPDSVSSKVNRILQSQSKVSSCLTTMAEARVDDPPSQVHSVVKPCSVATSGRYPNQYFRHVSCKRNISTAATGAIKKGADDSKVADGIHMEAPLFNIHYSPTIKGSVTQPVNGTERFQPLSPTPFPCEVVNNIHTSNEHKSSQGVIMPVTEDRSNSKGEAYSNAMQASSFNLSEVDALDDDGSSFSSKLSGALVTVGGYRVKENLAPILRDILSKYGDIAAQCCKKSIMLRSLLVENVCDIVQKLQAAEFAYITSFEVDSFRVFVEDLESDGVVVGWLLQRLDEISEAKKLLKGSSKVKQSIRQNRQVIKEKEDEISMLQEKIAYEKKELELKKEEERKLDEILSYTKAQVKRFHRGSMIGGLL